MAMIYVLDEIMDRANNGKSVSRMFLEVAKAFDCVDHKLVLQILSKRGVRGIVNNRFLRYLSDRGTMCADSRNCGEMEE